MRPIVLRALIMIGVVPMALGVFGLLNGARVLSWSGGLIFAGAMVTGAYALSWRFEGRHFGEPPLFWRDHEAKIRPRVFLAASALFLATCTLVVLAGLHHRTQTAAFFLPTAGMTGFIVYVMWGKVP